jgi:hypothetical protein
VASEYHAFCRETVTLRFFVLPPAITDGHLVARRTTLFSIMEGLLEKFKVRTSPFSLSLCRLPNLEADDLLISRSPS